MKQFKGTPGPWVAVEHYEDCLIVLDSNGYEVVTAESAAILNDYTKKLGIQHWSDDERGCLELTREQQSANASLIAAAPDLLEALQNLMDNYDNFRERSGKTGEPQNESMIAAKAAINKALGGE